MPRERRSRMRPRTLLAGLGAVVALGAASACGGDDTAAGGAASGGAAPEFAAEVRGDLERLSGRQTAPPEPGPPAVPGKTVAIVSVTLAEEGAKRNIAGLEAAARALGWRTTTYDGQGVPTTANKRIEEAVTARPDAIVLVGLDANIVAGGIAAARRAGIPVACATCWDPGAEDTRGPYVSAQPPLSQFEEMGHGIAQYAYEQTGGSPRFLVFNDPSLTNLSARERGLDRFLAECERAGGDCAKAGERDFLLAEMNTQLPAQAAALAQANPDHNAVWVSFDFAALQVLNGLRQAGKADPATSFMVAANGDGANLEEITGDGFQKATVAVSFEWAVYATMDNLNRLFAGQDPVEQDVPIRLFTAENAAEARGGNWTGDVDFAAVYERAWRGAR